MGEMTIDDNENCDSPKNESYITENGTQDSDEDEVIGNFRKVSKKRTGRAILDDSDEEIEEKPSEIPQITEIPDEKVSIQSDTNIPSDPTPFSINKFFQESDLFDAEESDEETTPYCKQENDVNVNKTKKSVKKSVKTKQSIRKEKEDVLNIHSETQRMVRQSSVSIPYHKPEQKTLQYFLNRRTRTPTEIKPLPVHLNEKTNENDAPSTENDIRMDDDDDSQDLPDPFAVGDETAPQNEAESAKIEEISTTGPIQDPGELENTLSVRATTPNVEKTVKSSGLTPSLTALRLLKADAPAPRLSEEPLHLDCDYSDQAAGLFQRLADHTLELRKTKREEKSEGDGAKVVKFSETPGAQLLSLKEKLRLKMAEKREIERQKRIELHEMDNERGFASEGEIEAEEEEEAELTDQTDTDEEEEEDDVVSFREKKVRRNIFIDDEAEDEEIEENDEEDADDEEEIEENDGLEEGDRSISISGFNNAENDTQNRIFEETQNNILDASNVSVDTNYGMVAMVTPGQRYTRSLSVETTPEFERACFSPETLKNRKLNRISSAEDEEATEKTMPMRAFNQYSDTQLSYNFNLSQIADSQIQVNTQRVVMDDLIGLCSGQFGSPKSPRKNLRKLIGPDEKSQNFDTLIGLCSGKFGSPKSPRKNLRRLIGPEEKSQNFDTLIGLCSGKFGSPVEKFERKRKRDEARDEMTDFHVSDDGDVDFQRENDEMDDFRGRNDEFSDERKRKRVEIEDMQVSDDGNADFRRKNDEIIDFQRKNDEFIDFQRKNDEIIDFQRKNDEIIDFQRKNDEIIDFQRKNDEIIDFRQKNDENESDDSETGELFRQNSTRKRKIVFESSESEAESSESGDEEAIYDENEERGDEEAIYDENEEIVTENVNRKRKIAEFFEKEAELSGSDASSDEDDMSDDDVLQEELGDLDECLPNQDALRDQVGRAHFKAMDDEDAREVRLLKEMYLQDGDLHTDGKGRERKFRWRDIYNEFQDGTETNCSDEENGDDEQEQEELRKKMEKLDKEKWMQEKAKEGGLEEPEMEFLNVRTNTHSIEVSGAEKSPLPFNFLSPMSPSKLKFRRGSFFSKAQSNPNKANDKTKTSETNAMGVKNSRKFVFAPASPRKQPVTELPEVSSARKKPKLERKNLNERFSQQEKSVFKFL